MRNKFKQHESGLTLIEILAALVITSIIFVLVTSILVNGMKNYNAIANESMLRDEADLMLSTVYKNMYSVKAKQILTNNPTSPHDQYITVQDSRCPDNKCIIGYKDGKFYTGGSAQPYTIQNSAIELIDGSVSLHAPTVKDLYNIEITLQIKNKNIEKKFNNKVRIIKDTE